MAGRDGDNIRDSILTREVSRGRTSEAISEALRSRAVVETVATRESVDNAIRITGSLESCTVSFVSLVFFTIEG